MNNIDVSENQLRQELPEVLALLLKDHTTGKNIFWATDSYSPMGDGFQYSDYIDADHITGEYGLVVRPRAVKTRAEQIGRTKEMAEVFTPSWVCNKQNNLIDEAWFGSKDVFNVEHTDTCTWTPSTEPITFPAGKTWRNYVRSTRMEITCGEAPYLVSRHDTTTGEFIPLQKRIGILDRKLRIVSENTSTSREWLRMAQEAYKHTYGFEWQGDNLLLAREALLMTFVEYYEAKFGKRPLRRSLEYIAYIISWNVWQMDGLKGVVPNSCKPKEETVEGLFETKTIVTFCPGCETNSIHQHTGQYCLIRDWDSRDPVSGEGNRKIRFIDLIR